MPFGHDNASLFCGVLMEVIGREVGVTEKLSLRRIVVWYNGVDMPVDAVRNGVLSLLGGEKRGTKDVRAV